MAPKRPAPAPPSSSESSSDDEQEFKKSTNPPQNLTNPSNEDNEAGEGSGNESSTSDSDADQTKDQTPSQPRSKPQQPSPNPTKSASSSGEEDEEFSEEEEDPAPAQRPARAVDPSIKPISSRPMDASPNFRKTFASSEPRAKKPKASSEPPSEQRRRLWGPDDEIAILRGIADYRSKKGALPTSIQDVEALHGLIRGSLQVEVTTTQLADKVRRLKQKFTAAATRGKNGAGPEFTKPHEKTAFELSKNLWGSKSTASENAGADSDEDAREESDDDNANPVAAGKLHRITNGNVESGKEKLSYPYFHEAIEQLGKDHPCGTSFKRAFELLDESKAKAMEEKFKKQRIADIRQHLRRMDLMKETVKMMLDALAKAE
ncbi:STOREKEEPER protein-like [Typha angustifolia]|uniref:STOREKEEPER protein-like n=1 Tax=Typha angustifolia TaxID=59011 RepID=UPI003C2EA37F